MLTEDDLGLITKLADTEYAAISGYPRRKEVWAPLPRTARSKIATSTAKEWFAEFLKGEHSVAPEPELSDAIISMTRESKYLSRLAADPMGGLRFFKTFTDVTEAFFTDWLKLVTKGPLQKDVAEAIGAHISFRSWSNAAGFLAEQARSGRSDLKPSLEYCRDLLGYITRFWLGIYGPMSESIKWRILEDIGAELFPLGPGDKSLWQRAGGQAADIPIAPSGREAWRIVVTDMENGGKRMKARDLVKTMLAEFPGNRVLQKLKQDHFYW
jgi:hypothetical protein